MKQPSTSTEAYKKVKEFGIDQNHHAKIIKALERLGTATGEQIADLLGMDVHQIMRRVNELEKEQVIYKPGTRFPNKKGNMCYQYCLLKSGQKVEHKIEKALEGKPVHQYAKELIQQPTLF